MPFTVTMPKLSPTMEEGMIVKWHKQENEYVHANELLLEINTDKATLEYNALDEGWLRKILSPEGKIVRVNEPIAIFTEQEHESLEEFTPQKPTPPPETIQPPSQEETHTPPPNTPTLTQPAFVPEPPLESPVTPSRKDKILASPLARRLAKQRGLDLTTIQGSGPGGRITSRDLEHAQPTGLVTFGRREFPKLPPGSYEEIPLTPMRKIIARRLQESKSFIPHFYVKQIIDAQPLVEIRTQLKAIGLSVTFNDLMLRACALTLRQHPQVNTGFHSVNQTIIQFKTIDISLAVTCEGGLITPIIRHADYKNLGQLSKEARHLITRARKGNLQEHEYKGGSFCLSNLGMYGITEFSAVINPPQSAILAIGGIEERVCLKNGIASPGKQMTLTLSVDHRVIDGTQAAEFLNTLQHLLENPVSLTIS